MKGAIFYNYHLIGDVLIVDIENDVAPNRSVTKDDVTLIYSNDKLLGINIFNVSSVIKFKSEGRIILPPDSLIDFINDKCSSFNIEKLDYVKETGFKVGKILEVEEHPESKKLHLLKVDVGSEVLDIVCGAVNVKENMKVVVATIGTVMMDGTVIKKGELLGEVSYGMCCSPRELGLKIEYPAHHLLEIEEDIQIGQDFFSLQSK